MDFPFRQAIPSRLRRVRINSSAAASPASWQLALCVGPKAPLPQRRVVQTPNRFGGGVAGERRKRGGAASVVISPRHLLALANDARRGSKARLGPQQFSINRASVCNRKPSKSASPRLRAASTLRRAIRQASLSRRRISPSPSFLPAESRSRILRVLHGPAPLLQRTTSLYHRLSGPSVVIW